MPRTTRPPIRRVDALKDTEKLIAVGRVIANWAFYEQHMDLWLRVLLNQPATDHFPKNLGIAFKRRIRLWRDLAAIHHPEPDKSARITEIIDKSANARHHRDWVAHGFWTVRGDIVKLAHGEATKIERRSIPLHKVTAVADQIADLTTAHILFYHSYAIKLATGKDIPD